MPSARTWGSTHSNPGNAWLNNGSMNSKYEKTSVQPLIIPLISIRCSQAIAQIWGYAVKIRCWKLRNYKRSEEWGSGGNVVKLTILSRTVSHIDNSDYLPIKHNKKYEVKNCGNLRDQICSLWSLWGITKITLLMGKEEYSRKKG